MVRDAHPVVPEIVCSLGDFDDLVSVQKRRADIKLHGHFIPHLWPTSVG
jgi:hypothetical protein